MAGLINRIVRLERAIRPSQPTSNVIESGGVYWTTAPGEHDYRAIVDPTYPGNKILAPAQALDLEKRGALLVRWVTME